MLNNFMLLKIINPILIIVLIIQAFTAVCLLLGVRVFGVHFVYDVHKYNGMLMLILAFVHLILNFGWIKSTFFKKRKV